MTGEPASGRRLGPLNPLRHRNYRLFWAGQLVSLTGTWVQSVAQGWLIAQLADPSGAHGQGITVWYLGIVSAAGSLPILFGALFGGVMADRVEKRRLIMVTQTIMMLCAFTLAGLVATHVVQIWHVITLAVVLGCATAFDLPTRQAFVVEMVGKEDLAGAVALNSGLFNAARMMGPAITGLMLAAHVSIAACFAINGLSFLAVIAGLWQMRMPPARVVKSNEHVFQTIREGLSYARHAPQVRRVLIFVGAFGTFAFSFNVLLPAFVRYYLAPGLDPAIQARSYGLLESVRGIGALAGAITAATLATRKLQRTLMIIGAVGSTGGLIAFSMMHALLPAYITMAFVSMSFVLCFSSANTLVQMNVPDHLRGRVMSLYVLLFSGTTPFGSFLAGSVAKAFGTPVAIRTGGFAAVAIVAIGALAEIRRGRHGKMVGSTGA